MYRGVSYDSEGWTIVAYIRRWVISQNDLYSSPSVVRVTKQRRIRWVGHIAHMGRGDVYTGFWWRNVRERDHLQDQSVDGSVILRWIFKKWDVGVWTGSS